MMPVAWMKGHRSYHGPSEPDEYDVECYAGSDPPDNEPGWVALVPKQAYDKLAIAALDLIDAADLTCHRKNEEIPVGECPCMFCVLKGLASTSLPESK